MNIPPGIDIATATRDELVAAYVDDLGYSREDAEAKADALLDPDPDIPLI